MPGTTAGPDSPTGLRNIYINLTLYGRIREISMDPFKWNELKDGVSVLCRTRKKMPDDIFSDKLGPMSCFSIVPVVGEEFKRWRQGESGQWFCPLCHVLNRFDIPSVGWGMWNEPTLWTGQVPVIYFNESLVRRDSSIV